MAADLERQAVDFADSLTETVGAVTASENPFRLRINDEQGDADFTIIQRDEAGIPLTVKGEVLLRLAVRFDCCLDTRDEWMAIHKSKIAVYPADLEAREPLFRYEYVRSGWKGTPPAAHVQFHFDREFMADVLDNAGRATRRAKRRAKRKTMVQDLHFPVGGHRFRPCLEDVLDLLIDELGLDHPDDAQDRLADGREKWRRQQTRAVVRDAPQEAAEVLRSEGYEVVWVGEGSEPDGNPQRLRER